MNEANTQAEFYHHARLIGMSVEVEMTTPVGRIDIAILDAKRNRLLAIVECKRENWPIYEESRQFVRYRSLGVPVYWLNKFSAAKELAEMIHKTHFNDAGVNLWGLCIVRAMRR